MPNTNFMKKVVGQEPVKKILHRLIEADKLPHALLFYGPEGVGKETAAMELARFMLCGKDNAPCGDCTSCRRFGRFEHPDFHFLFPIKKPKKEYKGGEWENAMDETEMQLYRKEVDKKSKDYYYRLSYPRAQSIIIGQVRQIIQQSSLTAFGEGGRFIIISPAHLMNKESQNSLLKLLEEPPEGFFLCLVTSRPEALLPTIISRCQPFYFPPLQKDTIREELEKNHGVKSDSALTIASRCDGSLVKAFDIVKNGEPLRKVAVDEFLTEIMRNNPIMLHQMIKKLTPFSAEKTEAVEILMNVDHWLRDIDMLDSGLEPDYHPDMIDRLQRFRNNFDYKDISKMRGLLMNAVDLINKNVYIDLIYLNLANQFNKLFQRKRK